ncbi:transposable element Tcb1 transposase [Trichonephila clavipes]|nr:transposable element Tcb1 transposase [Trichonephila clavipes]
MSSCAAEQFQIDASWEAMDQRAVNNLKNWQWTMQGDFSTRRSTPAPHGMAWAVVSTFVYLCRIPFTAHYQRLRLFWTQEHRAWKADWHQVVFSAESRFNVSDHDGRIRIRLYAGERCLPECVIKWHSCLNPGVMALGEISHHGRSIWLRIKGNLNINR